MWCSSERNKRRCRRRWYDGINSVYQVAISQRREYVLANNVCKYRGGRIVVVGYLLST
jgi:hypothetical protein